MHDIKFIREMPQDFDRAMEARGEKPCAGNILRLDEKLRQLKSQLNVLQTQKNLIAKEIGIAKSKGQELDNDILLQGEKVKDSVQKIEKSIPGINNKLTNYLINLPNIPHAAVPIGADESSNKQISEHGRLRRFEFQPQEHYEISGIQELMDFSTAVKMSGSRFVLLRKELAQLERALVNFMIDIHTGQFDYEEVSPPILVKDQAMFRAGQLPKFDEDSFKAGEGYRLIPTAEVPLVNIVSDSILSEEELPLRFVAHTPCFRSEAGSAGRDTHGMIRQHQFSKVELVSITRPKKSEYEHERMLEAAQKILQLLKLPYRIMLLSTGDMGFSASQTYDIEVWLPGQNQYREISSCSNCRDFQARRMNARYKELHTRKNHFVHTLNGSGLAVGRTMVAIIENYQNQDGSIQIPQALTKYMHGNTQIGGGI